MRVVDRSLQLSWMEVWAWILKPGSLLGALQLLVGCWALHARCREYGGPFGDFRLPGTGSLDSLDSPCDASCSMPWNHPWGSLHRLCSGLFDSILPYTVTTIFYSHDV